MVLSRGHETARLALHNAEAGLRTGDHEAACAWLRAAGQECEAWLREIDPAFRSWPQWARFRAACCQHPDPYDHRLGWRDGLQRSVVEARRAFEELEVVAQRYEPENLESRLAVALEDIFDQVWASEREWDFDDRLLGPSGSPRAGGG